MKKVDCNKDEGIITKIEGKQIQVHIAENESCIGCAAATLCEKTSNKGKDLTITQNNACDFAVGERVSVNTPQNKVIKAIGLAFFYPILIIIVFCLLQYFFFPLSDVVIGLVCLALLTLYFFVLYLRRNTSLLNFSIFIEKING